jgi:hypothetical protein
MNIAGKNVGLGAIVAAIGGVCAIVGVLLAWYTISMKTGGSYSGVSLEGSVEANAPGISNPAAILALVLGIVILALAAAWVMQVKIPFLAALIGLAGIAILVVLALSYFTDILQVRFTTTLSGVYKTMGGAEGFDTSIPAKAVKDVFDQIGKDIDQAKSQAGALGMSVSGGTSFGIGFFLEVAAGVLAIIGGGLGLLKKSA